MEPGDWIILPGAGGGLAHLGLLSFQPWSPYLMPQLSSMLRVLPDSEL